MPERQEKIKRAISRIMTEYPHVCLRDEPLAPYATYQVGGPADLFAIPQTIAQLEHIVRICLQEAAPYFVIGKGANILIHDDGFRGVVISLEKCCNQLFHEDNLLYVGTGVTVKDLVEYCENHGLSGLDYMSGIPGTVGGALTMNAGAFVGEIGDRVVRIDALNEMGLRVQISNTEALFGYRRADGLKGKLLLGCWILVEPGNRETLEAARKDYLERRAGKQPLEFPSCGSVFKRPQGDYAGRLIEETGLKGLQIGGAMVSVKHANFIVNYDKATAADIYNLICEVQKRVYEKFGVWLQTEVKLVGFSDEEQQKVEEPPDDQKR